MSALPFCPHKGKISYPTPKQAKLALHSIVRRKDDGKPRQVYFCRHCRGFHFGLDIFKVKNLKCRSYRKDRR